ncbi:hypothetical protein TNCV_2081241 [Trichonephila clavipes]|nr:hypothetical protein TNCV_2081241 [Trichonephila clavipes]
MSQGSNSTQFTLGNTTHKFGGAHRFDIRRAVAPTQSPRLVFVTGLSSRFLFNSPPGVLWGKNGNSFQPTREERDYAN